MTVTGPHELAYEQRWVNHPVYLTAERKQRNLLRNGSFEDQADNPVWTARSWRKNSRAAAIAEGVAQDGNRSVLLATDVADDVNFAQEVATINAGEGKLCLLIGARRRWLI